MPQQSPSMRTSLDQPRQCSQTHHPHCGSPRSGCSCSWSRSNCRRRWKKPNKPEQMNGGTVFDQASGCQDEHAWCNVKRGTFGQVRSFRLLVKHSKFMNVTCPFGLRIGRERTSAWVRNRLMIHTPFCLCMCSRHTMTAVAACSANMHVSTPSMHTCYHDAGWYPVLYVLFTTHSRHASAFSSLQTNL